MLKNIYCMSLMYFVISMNTKIAIVHFLLPPNSHSRVCFCSTICDVVWHSLLFGLRHVLGSFQNKCFLNVDGCNLQFFNPYM